MSTPWKLLRGVLLFLLVLVPFYAVVMNVSVLALPRSLVRNFSYPFAGHGHMLSRVQDARTAPPVDVLFLGSSHAYRGFDPRIFEKHGISSFNLGSSAQSPVQTEILVDRFIDRLDPRLVVYEVHAERLRADVVESTLDLAANAGMDPALWLVVLKSRNVRTLNAALHSTARAVLGLDDGVVQAAVHRGDRYVGRGYVEHPGADFEPVGTMAPQGSDHSDEQMSAFERTLARLRAEGRTVVLVEAPVTQWYGAAYRGHDQFKELMEAHGTYVDLHAMAGLNDTVHFYTKGHLDQAGVELFNAALIDTLEARGLLPVRTELPQ